MLDDFAICAVRAHATSPTESRPVPVDNHLRPWLPLLVAMSTNVLARARA